MKIAVWDTYVKKQDGSLMHFDILVPESIEDKRQIVEYGNMYLASKADPTSITATDRCEFCHIEQPDQKVIDQVEKTGFAIIEMENCN